MTKKELIADLEGLTELCRDDTEVGHVKADRLLLSYINDEEVKEAFGRLDRWYS